VKKALDDTLEMWYFIAGNFVFPRKSFYMYVSSVVGLLPFGGLDQLCTAQAESVFKPSVLFVVVSVVFFYCHFLKFRKRGERMNVKNTSRIITALLAVTLPVSCLAALWEMYCTTSSRLNP